MGGVRPRLDRTGQVSVRGFTGIDYNHTLGGCPCAIASRCVYTHDTPWGRSAHAPSTYAGRDSLYAATHASCDSEFRHL